MMSSSPLPIQQSTITTSLLLLLLTIVATTSRTVTAFSAGKGFGNNNSAPSNSNAFVSFDRFRASCPADRDAIRQFDPSLIKDNDESSSSDDSDDDVWVAVYRSANNLPSVFVRDAFLDSMKVSTTAQEGDAETLVTTASSSLPSNAIEVAGTKPVAVARLGKSKDVKSNGCYILDSMRCILKKENTDAECDGGSEHAEAIGVCIDELVLSYLTRYLNTNSEAEDDGTGEDDNNNNNNAGMSFDGGIRFRGTLISGILLDSRGFREVTELSADMHSHESDYDGALAKYAERSTSKEIAKNPGARDRALKILSYLGKVDREEDISRNKRGGGGGGEDEDESDFDPWASVKKFR